MKYVAILETKKELSEKAIEDLKDTLFVGNEQNSYCFEMTSIKQAPEPAHYDSFLGNFYYNNA